LRKGTVNAKAACWYANINLDASSEPIGMKNGQGKCFMDIEGLSSTCYRSDEATKQRSNEAMKQRSNEAGQQAPRLHLALERGLGGSRAKVKIRSLKTALRKFGSGGTECGTHPGFFDME
jgi:hypothetical protein